MENTGKARLDQAMESTSSPAFCLRQRLGEILPRKLHEQSMKAAAHRATVASNWYAETWSQIAGWMEQMIIDSPISLFKLFHVSEVLSMNSIN